MACRAKRQNEMEGMMNRTKVLIVVGCLLGLALAWLPAYASPSSRITLTCDSPNAGDSVSGSVTVTLCETTNCGSTPGDSSYVCTPVSCDSANIMSVKQACDAGFKATAVSVNICYQEDQDGNPTCTSHPGDGTGIALGKKGFSTVVGPGSPPYGDGDTVSLTVK
jgi:hypothetical protein